MITRDMIQSGYDAGLINLIRSPHDDGIVCSIGDNWFYFGGPTAEEFSNVEDYQNAIPAEDIVSEIFSVLDKGFKNSQEFKGEYLYYEDYLRERICEPVSGLYHKRYLDVDVISFLQKEVERNTKHYQSDFEIDKGIMEKAAASVRKEDKTLLWLSRSMGTQCVSEYSAFQRGSSANIVWQYYAQQEGDSYIAYAVEILGKENDVIRGNLSELDFKAHAAEVDAKAVTPDHYIWTFADGEDVHVPFGDASAPLCAKLGLQHGTMVDNVIVPKDKDGLTLVLQEQAAARSQVKETKRTKTVEQQTKASKGLQQPMPTFANEASGLSEDAHMHPQPKTERLAALRAYKSNSEMLKRAAEEQKQQETDALIAHIHALKPRIDHLIATGNECLKSNIPLEGSAWGMRESYDTNQFFTNSWSHLVGFVGNPQRKDCQIEFLGINAGGACGAYDFRTDGDRVFDVHESRPGDMKLPSIGHMKRFLSNFDEFESSFFSYVDKTIEAQKKSVDKLISFAQEKAGKQPEHQYKNIEHEI